jgi:solute carrier family 25 protein 34/35
MSTITQQQQQAQAQVPKPANKAKETALGFVIGGLAACGAVTFTNPWEVRNASQTSIDGFRIFI